MIRFVNAVFVTAATLPEDLPPPRGAEVAFAGRSNAGKSSVINALTGRNRLAFVAKTPGRTQQVVFFEVGNTQYLVDLPGYGYAKVPEEVRQRWEGLLAAYITGRASLRGLVLVMDARRPLVALDLQLLDWFASTGKPVHILLTKADKLSRSQAEATLRETKARLAAMGPGATVQLFSSLKGDGAAALKAQLVAWLTA